MDIESVYQKKTQLEHILLRPDSYIGSIERTDAQLWVKPEDSAHFVNRRVEYVPGLFKIFDEIIVNAADNYQRDASMTSIKVWLNRATGEIRVLNDGLGIPVEVHREHKLYVPEMIFGELLSGSNFNDNERKVTGGRNGYGAKLANIFSVQFAVETVDSRRGKRFRMTWRDNMTKKSAADVEKISGKKDYTEVRFLPDFARFHMSGFDADTYELFSKRVWDLAGVVHDSVKVFLNDERIPIKNFKGYVDLYFSARPRTRQLTDEGAKEGEALKVHYRGERWEVVLSISDGQFQQVSFVNAICTSRGGTHVSHVADQVVESLLSEIQRKNKKIQIKPHVIRNNIWLFVNCLIENPAFDSQTKETLTTKAAHFGSRCELPDKFFKELLRSNLVQQIVAAAEQKEDARLARALAGKKKSKLIGIKKLEDANYAGTKDAHKCFLILTEGDSAKSLALAGIDVIGRDYFGVFPLKGKLLNVRDAKKSQIAANEEIQNLIEIIGLQFGKSYDDVRSLRYGGIMIMSDQDADGSHIKGLIINLVAHFWPSLFERPGFLVEFVTPLLKCFGREGEQWFFGLGDFRQWAAGQDMAHWKIKYYKGLGSSTDKEAREYFRRLEEHRIRFIYAGPEDRDKIDMLFNEKRVHDRKTWLTTFDENNVVDYAKKELLFRDFVDKEMIHFSVYDNMRSIPSLVDGLKPGQRKIIYACFRRNARGEIKVAQLAGYVGQHAAYHHGEASLQSTIVGLAQDFVGSNNINLLLPNGQFGTRNSGGKDAASARYIHTELNPLTRLIFHPDDDHIVRYLNDDGQMVEPAYYMPILPMVLVNGAVGIGTGWSTFVPCFCPRQIAQGLLARLRGEPFPRLHPVYKGFKGDIICDGLNYIVKGCFHVNAADDVLDITELPIGKWTSVYKSFLEEMMKDPPQIDEIREHHTIRHVHFEVRLVSGQLAKLVDRGEVEKKFRLASSFSTANMVLFDRNGIIRKYDDVSDIINDFCELRLLAYIARKRYLLSRLQRELALLDNKRRFILAVIEDRVRLRKVRRNEILRQLIELGFTPFPRLPIIQSTKENPEVEVVRPEDGSAEEISSPGEIEEFNYLLSMPLFSLSLEKVEKINEEFEKKTKEFVALQAKPESDIWREDLENFLLHFEAREQKEKRELEREEQKAKGGKEALRPAKRKAQPRKKGIERQVFLNEEAASMLEPEKIQVTRPASIKGDGGTALNYASQVDGNEISRIRMKKKEELTLMEKLTLLRAEAGPRPSETVTGSRRSKLALDEE